MYLSIDSTFFLYIKGSTLKHGISLRTLIRKSAELSGPGLLVCLPFCAKNSMQHQHFKLKACPVSDMCRCPIPTQH